MLERVQVPSGPQLKSSETLGQSIRAFVHYAAGTINMDAGQGSLAPLPLTASLLPFGFNIRDSCIGPDVERFVLPLYRRIH